MTAEPGQDAQQRAALLLQSGDIPRAEAEAAQAIAAHPNAALANAVLGAIRLQEGRYAESARFLRAALRVDPGMVGARLNLGNCLILQGEPALAEAEFRQVLKLAPENLSAKLALVRLENEAEHYQQSLVFAEGISKELRGSEDGLTLLASDYLATGDFQLATQCLSDWLSLPHLSGTAAVTFAKLFASKGRIADAVTILQDADRRAENSFEVHFLLGEFLLTNKDLKKAAPEFQQALSVQSECAPCLYRLGEIAEQEGNLEESLGDLLRAKHLAPQDPDIQFAFGRVCLKKDLIADATTSLLLAVKLRPEKDVYRYLLASAYTSSHQYRPAIDLLEQLGKEHPQEPLFSYATGAVQYMARDFPAAERNLRASLQTSPGQIGASYYLAVTLQSEGKPEDAEKMLRSVLERVPDHQPAVLALGDLLADEKRYEESSEALRRAVALDPSSVRAHYQLGRVLARLGQTGESANEFAIVRTLNTAADARPELRIFDPER